MNHKDIGTSKRSFRYRRVTIILLLISEAIAYQQSKSIWEFAQQSLGEWAESA